ncbi:MAG: porin family protein [Bacteroidota bacterium]
MKKIYILCFLFCSLSFASQAQVRLGVKGGANLSFLIYDPDITFDNRPSIGFHLGGFAHFQVANRFGVQTEVLYTTLGGRAEGEFTQNGVTIQQEVTDNFNYIAIPIMIKYTSPSGFTAEVGPSINFLIKAEETIEESSGGQNLSTDIDLDEIIRGTDFMLGFGLGYELPSGLSFNGRFSFSLSDIFDTDSDFVSPDAPELRNAVFQLGVGFPVFGN